MPRTQGRYAPLNNGEIVSLASKMAQNPKNIDDRSIGRLIATLQPDNPNPPGRAAASRLYNALIRKEKPSFTPR